MKESNDALIKNLCDDIVITYRTLGTQYGQMYSCSRQTSQGQERLYNVSDTPTSNDLNPILGFTPRRPTRSGHTRNMFDFEEEPLSSSSPFNDEFALDDVMDSHDVSADTPYYSGRVATVMRSVTGEEAGEEDC
jgi:hypothetical protein